MKLNRMLSYMYSLMLGAAIVTSCPVFAMETLTQDIQDIKSITLESTEDNKNIVQKLSPMVDTLFSDPTKEYTITLKQLLASTTEDFSIKWKVGSFKIGTRDLALTFYNDNYTYQQEPILSIFSEDTLVEFKPTTPDITSYQPKVAFTAFLKRDNYYNLKIDIGY